jgi:uncharacterized protein
MGIDDVGSSAIGQGQLDRRAPQADFPPPALMQKRLQPRIDDYCLTVIRNASVCVVGFTDQVGIEFVNLRDTPVVRAEAEQIDLVWPAHTPQGSNPR